jgi:DNA modification methylase
MNEEAQDPIPDSSEKSGTRTSSFGSPGRSSHDASAFYSSRLYEGQLPGQVRHFKETEPPAQVLDRILLKSSRDMRDLPDHCVHLMVTSPPYNARKEYDEDLTLDEYRGLLRDVFQETWRVLVTGGRACINIANLGRKPYLPLHAMIISEMLDLGFLMRGEVIWDKAASASASTAWGSWLSAANPVLRDVHEYILIFSKDSFRRPSDGRESTISREEFLEWTKSVWSFPAVSARQIGHPAPFPEELPRRLIQLYTFKGDLVLDPFAGSGTTCLAARNLGRSYVGYETNPEYHELALKRLDASPD